MIYERQTYFEIQSRNIRTIQCYMQSFIKYILQLYITVINNEL